MTKNVPDCTQQREVQDVPPYQSGSSRIPDQGGKDSYGQILKSSAIIGASSLINILIGMVRTKFMAVFLGPSGMGLMGMYGSIIELAQSIAGMGVNSSGVRQIAEAVSTGDQQKIAVTAQVLRRTSVFLGLLGTVAVYAFAPEIAIVSFGTDQHADTIAILSLTLFISAISAGQAALIQGLRRISDLAKMNIFGTLFGATTSIVLVYLFHEDGIVLSMLITCVIALLTSAWYRHKITLPACALNKQALVKEQYSLLSLGFAFMSSGLMMTGAAYLVRIFIVQKIGLDAAGLYQSAWNLGGLYIGYILQAMGTDFYPRLTAVADDHVACNRIVNEQAHVSLLLAAPGVIATLTFAQMATDIFYSAKFAGAIELLRWLCLGMSLRIISWPMGFIIIAKSAQIILITVEAAWCVVYLTLTWFCLDAFNLNGVGIAFFISYIFHVMAAYLIARKLTAFHMSNANLHSSILYLIIITVNFCSYYLLQPLAYAFFGGTLTVLSCIYSLYTIVNLFSIDKVNNILLKRLRFLKFSS